MKPLPMRVPWFFRLRWRRWFWGSVVGVLLLLLWPSTLGGHAVTVVLQSDSMRPRFHRGDLLVLWKAPRYRPGDMVLYRGTHIPYVFHRIVGYDAQGRFVLKGDANSYLDPDHPSADAILGRYVFHLPRVGLLFLRWGRWPGWLLLGLAVFLWFWSRGPRGAPARGFHRVSRMK